QRPSAGHQPDRPRHARPNALVTPPSPGRRGAGTGRGLARPAHTPRAPAQVLVQLESLNPGGSIKDRVGVAMVEEAERRGWLQPGGTIIEATAGNTGVGLGLAAGVKGYRCV